MSLFLTDRLQIDTRALQVRKPHIKYFILFTLIGFTPHLKFALKIDSSVK